MKKNRLVFGALTTALVSSVLLSACSSDEPTPYKTPPAPSATSSTSSVVKNGDLMGSEGLGANAPGVANAGKAFGVDTSKVEIPQDVTEVWGDQAKTAPDDALKFWQVSMAIVPRWSSDTPSADDYRAVEPLMTVTAWDKLYAAAQQNPSQSIASDLVPGRNTDSTIEGTKIKAQTPFVLTPQKVEISLAQDEAKFGDTLARAKVSAVIPIVVTAEDGTLVTLQDKVTLYMLPYESGWQVDNWEPGTISKA